MEMSDLRSQDLQNAGPAPPAYMARSCRPGGGAYEEAEATSAKLAGAEGGLTTVRGLAHSDLFQITPHRVSVAVAVGLEHQVGDAAMVACRLGAGAPPEHFHRLRGPVAQDDAEGADAGKPRVGVLGRHLGHIAHGLPIGSELSQRPEQKSLSVLAAQHTASYTAIACRPRSARSVARAVGSPRMPRLASHAERRCGLTPPFAAPTVA